MAAVHPGAADKPDTGLLDANCDGIDGVRTGPVFVSPLGSDSSGGHHHRAPCRPSTRR